MNRFVKIMIQIVAILLIVYLSARAGYIWCEWGHGELGSKPEYSILQSKDWQYKDVDNNGTYKILDNLDKPYPTDDKIIGLPLKSGKGYAMMLAKAEADPYVKWCCSNDFTLTKQEYDEIKKEIELSFDVDAYLLLLTKLTEAEKQLHIIKSTVSNQNTSSLKNE
ncbi:MAG: hypothetical protein ABXS91_05145 [Sulfurimonas sp.]